MTDDPSRLKSMAEGADVKGTGDVVENIKTMSAALKNTDARGYEATAASVKQWTANVHDLKGNLDKQKEMSKQMREAARNTEEAESQSFRDKYRFLIERLKQDVRW